MIDSGIILIKYWLEVSPDEQTRRLKSRINDPRTSRVDGHNRRRASASPSISA